MTRNKTIALVGGGLGLGVLAYLGNRSANKVAAAIKTGVESGGAITLNLTGYWPHSAKASEKRMEGGVNDRKGRPLHTVEDFFAGKADHVSLSGDDAAWPYGQAVKIPWFDKAILGRVTDTGGSFRGANKKYRFLGREPIDVCVAYSTTPVPKGAIVAQIVPGDSYERGKAVAVSKFSGQSVAVGEGTTSDYLRGSDVLVACWG